jgi:bleomycin hydrolase
MSAFTEPKITYAETFSIAPPKAAPGSGSGGASGGASGGPSGGAASEMTPELLGNWRKEFADKPSHVLAQNAVTQVTVDDIALNRSVVTGTDHTFSHLLDDWAVTHQKKSGRCWLFAGLNLLRVGAMKKMNLKDFEFSQNFTLFWDKLERANYFLEAIIETAGLAVDDRTVAFLLDKPLDDGGQWNMFVNIVRKHGLVPKAVMPETQSSSDTYKMNALLIEKLREGAMTLRDLRGHGAPMEAVRAAKQGILHVIHRILCIHLGTPPDKFDWQWNDKDKVFHRDGELTPQEFARRYVVRPKRFTTGNTESTDRDRNGGDESKNPSSVSSVNSVVNPQNPSSVSSVPPGAVVNNSEAWEPLNLDDYVCLVNDPRETSPYFRSFTVQHLGNVVGGQRVIYLNVPMDLMKSIAMKTIMAGEPVWFGCDVGKMMRKDMGLWDANLFDYGTLYDTTFELTKAQRLLYHQTQMTHAMLFTGVDVIGGTGSVGAAAANLPLPSGAGEGRGEGRAGEGFDSTNMRPRRWRVENSWGEENTGRKGFFVMNDNWFDEHMFEIAARKSALPPELLDALMHDPIVLPPWDPMGALAE